MGMRFSKHREDEPEINLIPFIDVLLVILIFLMLSTTYSRFTELQINLPTANAEQIRERPQELVVTVSSDGLYALNRRALSGRTVEMLSEELAREAQGKPDSVVIISADATAAHQSVVNVLDAARRVGLNRITFAAQGSEGGAAPAP
jgi:biopolymer transport protein ExbD